MLLFSDKPDVPPLFRALAANFRQYKMDFAMAAASDQALMRQFNVPRVSGGKSRRGEGRCCRARCWGHPFGSTCMP